LPQNEQWNSSIWVTSLSPSRREGEAEQIHLFASKRAQITVLLDALGQLALQWRSLRALIICAEPEVARSQPDSVASVLVDLGCGVDLARFDLGDIDEERLARWKNLMIVIDAGDDVPRAQRTLRKLKEEGPLADRPVIIAISLARLPALDVSAGFDDFVLLPVVPAELYARLRQLDWHSATFGSEEVLKIDELVIDVAGYEARLGGRRLELTHQEFELLRFLSQHRGRVFTRDQLLERVWGYQYAGGTRTVDIHVRRVRAKLGAHAGGLIETVRNVGYKMRGDRADD
jgi:DNA-binding response OmpR family regulator